MHTRTYIYIHTHTHTQVGTTDFKNRGVAPRSIAHVFREIENRSQFTTVVRVSYLEIYMEQFFDLLDDSGVALGDLAVRDDDNGNVYVKGLKRHVVESEEEGLNYLFQGESNRAVGAHNMNRNSSRSHALFTVYLEQRSRVESSAKIVSSKLHVRCVCVCVCTCGSDAVILC
jgi:kinesin family protein 6/9